MLYIQIPEKYDARGFLLLAKSGIPVSCLPRNVYRVVPEHLKLLKRKQIPFKKLASKSVRLPLHVFRIIDGLKTEGRRTGNDSFKSA